MSNLRLPPVVDPETLADWPDDLAGLLDSWATILEDHQDNIRHHMAQQRATCH